MSRASIELIQNAYVLPLTFIEPSREGRLGRFDGSVHYSDRQVCELAAIQMPECLHEPASPASFEHVSPEMTAGHHVFGGLLNNVHFGHFITESLVRLWAINNLASSYDTVVFYKYSPTAEVPNFVIDTLKILAPDVNISVLNAPTSFEHLAVPQELKQGSYLYGHPLNIEMCKRLRSFIGTSDGPKKVYISRSRLNIGNGGLIYEELIDDYMRAEGYSVLYPEAMSIREQLDVYSNAEKLVFADGSAVHLYALVAQPSQSVFVIHRRGKYRVYDWQIGTLGGPRVRGESHIVELWVPEADPSRSFGKGVLNFVALSRELFEAGFISSNSWENPTPSEIRERLAAIMEERKLSYVQISIPD